MVKKKQVKKDGMKIFNIHIPQELFDNIERAIYGNVKKDKKKNGRNKHKRV